MKYIFWPLIFLLLLGWILGFFVFKILGGIIHLLLLVAAIMIVYNFFTGRNK